MTSREFYEALEEVIEANRGTISGTEAVKGLPGWDSVAVIGFIAMLDSRLGISVAADDIVSCLTVADLMKLLGGRIQD